MNAGFRRSLTIAAALAAATGMLAAAPAAGAQGAKPAEPPFVLHVERHAGGISAGVRAQVDAQRALARLVAPALSRRVARSVGPNVLMNGDSNPPYPQDEAAVAYDVFRPLRAVAAANDYVNGGFWIGRTADGGRTWKTTFKSPLSLRSSEQCYGADPSVVYSRRDRAFYLSTLCFTLTTGVSELHIWKSVDDGRSWTPSDLAAVPISNVGPDGVDTSVFYDKELLAVDNRPASRFYGRLYVTYVKFHMLPDGYSDTCPLQVAWTNEVPTDDPSASVWRTVAVVPDDPDALGVGESANQGASPVVDDTGALNIAYVLEECNTSVDGGIRFTRSTSGGNTWSDPIAVAEGEWVTNPDPEDLLPGKNPRIPEFPSLVFNPGTKALDMLIMNSATMDTSGTEIAFTRSIDHGETWSALKTISRARGAPAPNDQFFPALAVDESGNLHAIWYDNRRDPGNVLIETYQAFSKDDGRTWRQWRISTRSWDPNASFFSCGCFIGDYNGIAASRGVVYPVWADGRRTPGPPWGDTDIYTNVEVGGIH